MESSRLTEHQRLNTWFQQGRHTLKRKQSISPLELNRKKAKNVILFVGDGMGVSTVTAARILAGQKKGLPGESHLLSFEHFPYTGFSKTYNTDLQVPDSAGTMTAMMTGVKTDAGVINIDENVVRGDCQSQYGNSLVSALMLAELSGKATGVVSTASLTHATPAATYAWAPDRSWENDAKVPQEAKKHGCVDIAQQLIEFEARLSARFPDRLVDGIEVALGGGREHFLPAQARYNRERPTTQVEGLRQDGRNLVREWQNLYPEGNYVDDLSSFQRTKFSEVTRLLGLFNPSHMEYESVREDDVLGEPSLAEMTSAALSVLEQREAGYFLVVEGGRIDHAHHSLSAYNALHETIAFSDAVSSALEQVDLDETLIIVTADHSHVMTMAGYPKRGNPILGKVVDTKDRLVLARDKKPYTTLGYSNGQPEGFKSEARVRTDLTHIDTASPDFIHQTLVPTSAETHGGEDVGIYSIGPGAHVLTGVNEQNFIFHAIMSATGMVPIH